MRCPLVNEILKFCQGSDDECEDTGVYNKNFLFYKNELILVNAIKEDNSIVLFVFDPKVDEKRNFLP